MCPYPAQVKRETVIEQARAMIEAEGLEQVSLHRLAAALGIKAPSLYRYMSSRGDLLRAVNELTSRELIAALNDAARDADAPETRMLDMARAYRAFALAHPATYGLVFTNALPEARPDAQTLEALALPVQEVMAGVSGEAESLAALRGVWALIHGFVMLELSGQFQRGGDLDAAFEQAVTAYLRGWEADSTQRAKEKHSAETQRLRGSERMT